MLTRDHLPLLHAARELIETGREEFICLAANEAHYRQDQRLFDASPKLLDDIVHHVQSALAGYETLEEWLAEEIAPDYSYSPRITLRAHNINTRHMTLARLAWLDKIIHDIEENT